MGEFAQKYIFFACGSPCLVSSIALQQVLLRLIHICLMRAVDDPTWQALPLDFLSRCARLIWLPRWADHAQPATYLLCCCSISMGETLVLIHLVLERSKDRWEGRVSFRCTNIFWVHSHLVTVFCLVLQDLNLDFPFHFHNSGGCRCWTGYQLGWFWTRSFVWGTSCFSFSVLLDLSLPEGLLVISPSGGFVSSPDVCLGVV